MPTVATWPGAVTSPSRSVKRTVVLSPVTGPKRAARLVSRTLNSPVDLTDRAGPGDPPLPAEIAGDERDDALGQPRQFLGLEPLAEMDARHVEQGMPVAAVEVVVDRDLGDARAARRVA